MSDWLAPILAAIVGISPFAPAVAAPGESCVAMVQGDSGVHTVQIPSFAVAGTTEPLALPADAVGASAIMCVRQSLSMSDEDYRVLTQLHLPFAFSDGERVVWLYVEDERLLMHMDDGVLSSDERAQIEAAIARAQAIMLREGW